MIKKILSNKYGKIGLAIFSILTIYHIFFGGNHGVSALEPNDIAPKIKDISNGKIELQHVNVVKRSDYSLYLAGWNDFMVMGKVNKDNHMATIGVTTTVTTDQMDEISLGQYLDFAKDVIGIVNPKLSNNEKDHILQNDLDFNDVLENGIGHTINVDGQKYSLDGGNGGYLLFSIKDVKK